VNTQIHHARRPDNLAIFAKSQAIGGPSLLDFVGEGLAALRKVRLRPQTIHLGPVPLGDGHPVLVLPAFLCSDLMSRNLRDWLTALGYAVEGWGAGVNIGPTRSAVAAADRSLRRITQESGRKATLVGVSLGGVLGRAMANAYPHLVRRVITVCSPFRLPTASPLEPFYRVLAPLHGGMDMLLGRLTQPPPVPTTAIYCPRDGVVAWRSCVDAPGPGRENISIEGAHHTTMLTHPKTLRVIAERLALPEEPAVSKSA
jgi:pimeloyl-ACP methyl ester carboxylesterase